jgi:hypothetical protein
LLVQQYQRCRQAEERRAFGFFVGSSDCLS